jgi:hypothetical protein
VQLSRIVGLFATSLSLVALYLVLRNAGGATQILRAIGSGSVDIFRTLQGR